MRRIYLAAALQAIGLVPLVGAVIVNATKANHPSPDALGSAPGPYRDLGQV